jgi:signal transduction histidine kinase
MRGGGGPPSTRSTGCSARTLRNVRLIDELRASRRRIVAAQDERAKQLERNIHDGAQQQLVALTVKLRLAEGLAEREPAKTRAMLSELQAEATSALEDLRDLARGIYPPDARLPGDSRVQTRILGAGFCFLPTPLSRTA